MFKMVSVFSVRHMSLGEPKLNLWSGRKLQFSKYLSTTILIVEVSAWSIFIKHLQQMLKFETFYRVLISPKATCPWHVSMVLFFEFTVSSDVLPNFMNKFNFPTSRCLLFSHWRLSSWITFSAILWKEATLEACCCPRNINRVLIWYLHNGMETELFHCGSCRQWEAELHGVAQKCWGHRFFLQGFTGMRFVKIMK